jgi:uncharacterized protein
MGLPLMPKATAVWLVENTKLTFQQIADFCGMHPLEVQGIADGEVASSISGINPIENGQVTREMLELCEANPNAKIKSSYERAKNKGGKYTPVARRQDKPEAISWLIKHHPYIPESKIIKLIGTTKSTIEKVRDKTHWNSKDMTPKDPVLLGLCSQYELDNLIRKHRVEEQAPDVQEAS